MAPDTIARADVCILGAGAAGCVLAARLTEEPTRRVCLVEAGPDHGHLDAGRWPPDLLDASDCATSHDWGYGVDSCARVVGGCSAHNGCLVVRGTAADYDEWAAATGDAGWGAAAMARHLARAEATIGTRRFADDELGSWTRAALAGWHELGEPVLDDFNAPAERAGAGLIPVNRRGRTRWGAALAYLDPARGRGNLELVADALVTRLVIAAGRVRGVDVVGDGRLRRIEAPLVVLAAGAYGSPAILLRSGIGAAADLVALGIDVVADVPAVGAHLADHPAVRVQVRARPRLAAALAADDARGALTHVQATLKAASPRCAPGTFDLHVLANVGWDVDAAGRRTGDHGVSLVPVLMKPRSLGTVRLASADATVVPVIDRRLFADSEGHDAAVIAHGVERAQALLETAALADLVDPATALADLAGAAALYHPTGTCRMGADDPTRSVADADGRVRAVAGLRVADASALPTVPRANTHLSVLALAEAMAERIARADA